MWFSDVLYIINFVAKVVQHSHYLAIMSLVCHFQLKKYNIVSFKLPIPLYNNVQLRVSWTETKKQLHKTALKKREKRESGCIAVQVLNRDATTGRKSGLDGI